MEWLIAMMAVVVLGIAALAATGRLGQLGRAQSDRRNYQLPDAPLTAQDLAEVRFLVVPRGYAMKQVDELLERLRLQLSGTPESVLATESGIIDPKQLTDRKKHDGSDETSHGGRTD